VPKHRLLQEISVYGILFHNLLMQLCCYHLYYVSKGMYYETRGLRFVFNDTETYWQKDR